VAKAETEQNDYRRLRAINTFFSPEKRYGPIRYPTLHWSAPHRRWREMTLRVSVLTYATTILVGSSLALMALLYGVLKRQLRTRGA
jgi:hypothetical protein